MGQSSSECIFGTQTRYFQVCVVVLNIRIGWRFLNDRLIADSLKILGLKIWKCKIRLKEGKYHDSFLCCLEDSKLQVFLIFVKSVVS